MRIGECKKCYQRQSGDQEHTNKNTFAGGITAIPSKNKDNEEDEQSQQRKHFQYPQKFILPPPVGKFCKRQIQSHPTMNYCDRNSQSDIPLKPSNPELLFR